MALISVEYEVHGKVQGVFFRKYTEEKAKNLGLRGFVKNTKRGTVVGVIQGTQDKISTMKQWLQTEGSRMSRIENCDFTNEKQIENYQRYKTKPLFTSKRKRIQNYYGKTSNTSRESLTEAHQIHVSSNKIYKLRVNPYTSAYRQMHQVELAEEHRARIENRQMCQVQMLIRQNHCRDLRQYNAPSNPSDRPDLVARVFNLKLQQLLHEIVSQHVLGVVIARVHVVEFQKRGLPHAHMLFMLREEDKPRDRDAIDRLVCAEIPSPTMQVQLYDMLTEANNYGYPRYRRQDDGQTLVVGTHEVDNRWVVPYNPYLLVRFNAHINVEVCASVKSVKYLFKYVYKGHDRAEVEVSVGELDMESRAHDEIKNFHDARAVGKIVIPLASTGIAATLLSGGQTVHSRFKLPIPLLENSVAAISANSSEAELIRRSSLIIWDEAPMAHYRALEIVDRLLKDIMHCDLAFGGKVVVLGGDFRQVLPVPVCDFNVRFRCSSGKIIVEIFADIMPQVPDLVARVFNLKLQQLLHEIVSQHVLGVVIARVHVVEFQKRGLPHAHMLFMLREEDKPRDRDAIDRLVCAEIPSPTMQVQLYDMLTEANNNGYPRYRRQDDGQTLVVGTHEVDNRWVVPYNPYLLVRFNAHINVEVCASVKSVKYLFKYVYKGHDRAEVEVSVGELDMESRAHDEIKNFHDARAVGKIVIPLASTGIAATLLSGGQTVHSRFKLPIPLLENSVAAISANSSEAELIRRSSLIIWDEAPMAHYRALEIVDRLLKDIMHCDLAFGGKVVVLGGDFRQVLPVVPRASRAEIVAACIKQSKLWPLFVILRLTQNMRAGIDAQSFSQWLLKVGDGDLPTDQQGLISLPESCIFHGVDLVQEIFGSSYGDITALSQSVILTPKNTDSLEINEKVLDRLPNRSQCFLSVDSVECENVEEQNNYPTEFLNSLTPTGMPPHRLNLKIGAIVMLLRNLNPKQGLCNGTRMVIQRMRSHVLEAQILTGTKVGQTVLVPKISLAPSDTNLPFILKRRQFPLRLAFAMTINKAQGQTFARVSILSKGLKHRYPSKLDKIPLIAGIETSITGLNMQDKHSVRNHVTSVLNSPTNDLANSHHTNQIIRTLSKNNNIVITRSDKGSRTVIMNTSDYISGMNQILSNSEIFTPATVEEHTTSNSKYKKELRTLCRNRIITTDELQGFLSNLHGQAYIYGLPKPR
ncbi:hypothetical protein LAZ67_16002666 [Cordylochernes scorpioides]|uniref:ATP-dependent DNA helicase n=1 Tax=Cordylochernes scorpioides TaxID=51811 RepID=A0ABY6LC55_9ARAC|nr:hypothetical protein LAZ67_16002666 [Cordylochernes scorpioides]